MAANMSTDTAYHIVVSAEDFSVADEYAALAEGCEAGAVVMFSGKVRDMNLGDNVTGLILEHYPGMTEKALGEICKEASERWTLLDVRVIHRIGKLDIGDQIVFVGVTSVHRGAAFAACEFIMDYLKTRAPFWKKESTTERDRWIEARGTDQQAAERW